MVAIIGPAIEIVVTKVGSQTIDDENSEDGKTWMEAFRKGADEIPGCRRACWARSYKDPSVAMHFIDYETRRQHDLHKELIGGPIPGPLQKIMSKDTTDLYVISPHTPDRSVLYAPQTNVVFFYGINEDKFADLAPEFFSAISNSDSCVGYIWGEFQPPFLSDASKNMVLGKGGVMISCWRSQEEHDRDVAKERVVNAYKAMDAAVKKKCTWGMSVTMIEHGGYIHKWRRLPMKNGDRSGWLPAPGMAKTATGA